MRRKQERTKSNGGGGEDVRVSCWRGEDDRAVTCEAISRKVASIIARPPVLGPHDRLCITISTVAPAGNEQRTQELR